MADGISSLNSIAWGTTTGGAAGAAETTLTLGVDRADTRTPPDTSHVWGSALNNAKNLLIAMSQTFKGGTRLGVLTQSSNPFGAAESGFYIDTAGVGYVVFNGTRTAIAGGAASTGNWTFSGNNADLSGAATMGIGGTTASAISVGRSAITTTLASTALTLAANPVFSCGSASTNTVGASFVPNVADGASSVAFDINNATTLSNATASLFRIRNNGTALLNTRVNSTDGIAFFDGAGTSFLKLSTAVGSRMGYTGGASVFAGSINCTFGDGTGLIDMTAGNVTATVFQILPDADGTRDFGLVGTRWRIGAFKRIHQGRFVVTSSATPAFDPANGDKQRMILTANVTSWTLAAGQSGEQITIEFIQDGTGSRTLAGTPANVKLAGGALTLSTGINKRDLLTLEYDSTDSNWYEHTRSLNC